MRFLIGLIMALCLLTACDSKRVYEDNHDFNDRAWKSSDTAAFEFGIADASRKYNVYYTVRNSLDYPWARLFVQYSLKDSAGVSLQKKLVSQYLFDQKTGKPFGNSGLGDLYDHQFLILKNQDFRHPGKYAVRLEQFMRTDTLKGILSVGIRVEKADESGQ